MRITISLSLILILASAVPGPAQACSVFVLDDGSQHYYGSNYDWHSGTGYVLVNQRGMAKTSWALPDDPGKPLQWQAKYGSVTFVQYGRGLPKGGINEAGLVIEGLLLLDTRYPQPDDRPYIGSTSLFKQYLLDTCATVESVVEKLRRVRPAVYPWAVGVQFMVADATGDCAVIAFVNGRTRVWRGDNLPVKALINEAYEKSIHRRHERTAVDSMVMTGGGDRMRTISERLRQYRPGEETGPVDYAMETLDRVSAGAHTRWRLVYDQQNQKVYWRCRPDEALRWIDLKKINFQCGGPILALPVRRPLAGEANAYLAEYTGRDNRNLVRRAMEESRYVLAVPETLWAMVWEWPDQNACAAD